MAKIRIPASAYRLQFNQHFRFADAKALVPYLHQLGITELYASPLLQARHGSGHGYDVTDPTHLNVELGTDEEFDALAAELHRHGMGLLLDIVPNHMATGSENRWWMDLLEDAAFEKWASTRPSYSFATLSHHTTRISGVSCRKGWRTLRRILCTG